MTFSIGIGIVIHDTYSGDNGSDFGDNGSESGGDVSDSGDHDG